MGDAARALRSVVVWLVVPHFCCCLGGASAAATDYVGPRADPVAPVFESPRLDRAAPRVTDRLLIGELLARYARAVDCEDWELYRECFTADAVIDYTNAGGISGGVDTVTEWMETDAFRWVDSQHMISNVEINFDPVDPNKASVRAMFHNPLLISLIPVPIFRQALTVGGWYRHRLVRSDEHGWRSEHIWEEIAYFSINPAPLVFIMLGWMLCDRVRRWPVVAAAGSQSSASKANAE